MKPETITRAVAALPATLTELAERLGLSENGARYTIKHLKLGGYAQEWGRVLTERGTLVEALEKADKISGYPNNRKVITAARARLAGGIFATENAHLFTVEAALKAFAHVKPLGES